MSNLLSSLVTTSRALKAFERGLDATQNNISNASTPGFAKQRATLLASPFEPDLGFAGGVSAGNLENSRNQYAEKTVRKAQEHLAKYSETSRLLAQVEPVFSVTAGAGVPGAMDRLFASFSHLSVNPNDATARQTVISRAGEVAAAFRKTAAGIGDVMASADQGIRSTVNSINRLAGRIADINVERRGDFRNRNDAGIDAELHRTLEELSELVDFTSIENEDGAISVFIGGEGALVIGDRSFDVTADFSGNSVRLEGSGGEDLTRTISGGTLSAQIESRNELLPSYSAELDTLAASLATAVNDTLSTGLDQNGLTPTRNLFTFSVAAAAATIDVTDMTPSEIAASQAGAPGGNGNALLLAGLANQKQSNGYTFTESYGNIAARLGRELEGARQNERVQESVLSQATSMRAEYSAVSLDEEAANLMQFQRSYEAAAKMFTVLDEMTQTILSIVR